MVKDVRREEIKAGEVSSSNARLCFDGHMLAPDVGHRHKAGIYRSETLCSSARRKNVFVSCTRGHAGLHTHSEHMIVPQLGEMQSYKSQLGEGMTLVFGKLTAFAIGFYASRTVVRSCFNSRCHHLIR